MAWKNNNKRKVRLTRHARTRANERELDYKVLRDVAEAVKPLLNGRTLRFRHKGHTIVARKTLDGDIKVVTAWK